MNYFTIPPPPSLSNYVRCFWVLEGDGPYIHRSMADGCAEMVFHFKGLFDEIGVQDIIEKSFAAGFNGPSQMFRRFVTHENFGIFGAYLYPYAIPQIFSLPAETLANQVPDLQALLGAAGKELAEKIFSARDNLRRTAILSDYFITQLSKNEQKEPAILAVINQIIHSAGTTTVSELARTHFLSTRQFERKFKTFSGFSPKLFLRIIRFQSAISHYGKKRISLTDIAYNCGYYDQSHFIQDFKSFSGFHPRQYFSGNTEGTTWKDDQVIPGGNIS